MNPHGNLHAQVNQQLIELSYMLATPWLCSIREQQKMVAIREPAAQHNGQITSGAPATSVNQAQ